MPPDVSVIIPVYNAVDYVSDAIQSVLDQTITPDSVEMLVVDDGSTDGSDRVIAELAAEEPRISVFTQQNSGTPGGGRNPAIGHARGEFLFFLDSDDRLPPESLRRMVGIAQREDSDVVLGKIASTDKRRVPTSTFRRTVLDAHLVDDKVFNTLGPTKLIRREIVDRLKLRFPEDLKVGEDQPFMASVYLNARKVSILSDMDYYVTRHRTDGSNMTLTRQTSAAHVDVATRVARVIEDYTQPGELRDGLLRRPLDWSIHRALDARWTEQSEREQVSLADQLRSGLGHLYSEGARRAVRSETRAKLDLLMKGDLEGLNTCIAFWKKTSSQRIGWVDGDFRLLVTDEIAELVPVEDRVVPAPKMSCRLEDVTVEGTSITVSASVGITSFLGAPERLLLRARRRRSDDVVEDFAQTYVDLTAGTGPYYVSGAHPGLPRGVWDIYVVVRFGDLEKEFRLGADRSRTLEPEGVSNLMDDPAPQDRVMAYFTQGSGSLSVDCGSVLHKQLARARVRGMTLDENGRALLLVQTTHAPRPQDEYFGYILGLPQHGGRQLLPSTQLGERLVALRLPLTPRMVGATLTVTSVLGGATAPLPITGTEYWPGRAAGFGLEPAADGGLAVVSAGQSRTDRRSAPSAARRLRRSGEERARAIVRSAARAPVVGGALRAAIRAVRERRS